MWEKTGAGLFLGECPRHRNKSIVPTVHTRGIYYCQPEKYFPPPEFLKFFPVFFAEFIKAYIPLFYMFHKPQNGHMPRKKFLFQQNKAVN